MRSKYCAYLIENDLPDYFIELTDFPYSKKLKVSKKIVDKYGRELFIKAGFIYKENYIDKNRVNYNLFKNTLKSICKKLIKE